MMRISKAAQHSGLSSKMIRHYEDVGLIRPAARTEAGYRQYSPAQLEQLGFIRHARSLGFSIAQIRDLLQLRDNPRRASREVKQLAQKHLQELDQQMLALKKMQAMLEDLVTRCAGDDSPDCVIIDELSDSGETANE
ncbi:Cu(I)-responsive transcriptional regulator [Pseudohongiella sp. SYSU M77423]|uniref:Cu(I)-responsive transcriptional regulator n=1 Tax=Pseudohongiella sp. SYSU M77423 TaxID=3042312 RepID=UPI00294FF33F|nr:Cu(I)-responsive transcriptional regulator [Pseudohongiella sp. SYSU M77423]